MTTQTSNSICPKCSAPIATGAPQGLCPKCVLLGVATSPKPRGKEGHAPAPHEIAPHFPELEVLELIGVGGMGAVYKARQTKLGRLVALKVLSSALAGDAEFLERFDREARVLGRLNHPGIVTVFDSGMAGPCAYLLMEYVDGVNLRQAMQSGGFTPREALAVTQEICSALEYAHGQGILHRDIKPENILIDGTGRVKIADFGIAKLVGDQGPDHATLTMKGAVLGSMSYMAPEQFDAPGDVDQRADIYSLGVVLYELLTGELPRGRFGPPSDKSAVDARIDEIVMRTLEREREARFQNVHQMKTQMDAATQPGIAPAPASESVLGPKTARFANVSLLCTVLSLPMGLVALALFMPMWTMKKQTGFGSGGLFIFATIFLLFLVSTAGPGIVLAVRALGRIRNSGGTLAGFTRAIVAALTWPALLVLTMAGYGLAAIVRPGDLLTLLLGVLLLAASGLGVVMMRKVILWVRNSGAAGSPRRHVWLFAATAFIAVICMGANIRGSEKLQFVMRYKSDSADSEKSGAKTELKMNVAAGKMMTFQVVRIDEQGKETPVALSGVIHAPTDRDFEATLTVTSTESKKSGVRQELSLGYRVFTGERYSETVSLDDKWTFRLSGQGSSQIFEGNKKRIELGTRNDLFGKKVETLYIEIIGSTLPGAPAPAIEKQP